MEALADGATGVVVLGHGSRAPEAKGLLDWVAEKLAERLQLPVLAASLQFNQPTLDDCCHELAAAGARRIIIAPYFLFAGNHMQRDIPEELSRLRQELAGTEIILAEPLGAHELLVEVLASRTREKTGDDSDAGDVLASFLDAGCSTCPPLPQHPIEAESFEIIDSLLEPDDSEDPEYQVVRRVVHTTGDPSLARGVVFSGAAVGAGLEALATGAGIYCDVKMAAAGIEPTASARGLDVSCLVGDPATIAMAKQFGITRGAAAMRLAVERPAQNWSADDAARDQSADGSGLDGAIVAVGNSPTALFELLRLVREEGVRPALVVGVPVGFVGAAESKQELLASGLPCITIPGNRGGSAIAAAIVNALMRLSVKARQEMD